MKIAIVGSRAFESLLLVRFYVSRLPADSIVISGGAKGVDKFAEDEARARGLLVRIYEAEWEKYGRSAGMRRNGAIVEDAEKIVAFWDGKSRGTKNSVERAIEAQKPCFVVRETGEWRRVSPKPIGPGTANARGLLVVPTRSFDPARGGTSQDASSIELVVGEMP